MDFQQNVRAEAEKKLIEASERNLGLFIQELTGELCNDGNDPTIRQIAAIMLKNTISAKNKKEDEEKGKRWLGLPEDTTNAAKQQIFNAIKVPINTVSSAACQIISKLGRIELPANRWPDFLENLLSMVTSEDKHAKKASLTCLGYLCEEVAEILEEFNVELLTEEQHNKILTTIMQGMRDNDPAVKIAASKAFYHAILFARSNLEKENEKNFIFEVLTLNCKENDKEVCLRSFECLVQIVTEFYEYISPFMPTIFPLTIEAINEGEEQVAIPALEFWNSICDEEISILNGESKRSSHNFIEQASQYLLPILLETLSRQDDEDDEIDAWTLSKSAAICVSLCAQVIGDGILKYTLDFVNANFVSEDWKRREAALLAYGSIMEGPKTETLRPIIVQSFGSICAALKDSSEAVRDTAAWTIGRMVAFHAPVIIPLLGDTGAPNTESPLAIIVNRLTDSPRVAVNICWIINELADQLNKTALSEYDDETMSITILDPLFQTLCDALIAVSERSDADEKNLREAALTTLISLIHGVGDSCKPAMLKLYEHFLQLLERSFAFERSPRIVDLQGLMCGCLQVLITRLENEIIPSAPRTWQCLLIVFKSSGNDGLSEDALLTTSALANVLEGDFEPFMDEFISYLLMGLHRTEELSTCKVCIELVGDISRALKQRFLKHCESIMRQLYNTLRDPDADRTLKPAIMIAVGDVAMAISGEFLRYLLPFMQLLTQAANTLIDMGPVENEDWIWYIADLREGVLQAYSGIVYGMKDGDKKEELRHYVNAMLELVQLVVNTDAEYFSETNLSSAIALTGDLVNTFESDICDHLRRAPFMETMLAKAKSLGDDDDHDAMKDCKKKAMWLQQVITRYSLINPSVS
ncbi:HEAT repeat-containing protein [Cardiosporidium cionae]|uniref:HEAT repeat-containing protein n=1 Tax=Cardiosporidium cionae TaxID=476202 RepID=A0ABQ7JEM5_9APIC|nr:HEAT repeat-containing protein [Cardiosporidium cionae]|eukprot:KAF8822423.1 HEAT repeat-containing protein [Cardiosporidium cionae]